jgi:hypothetical protein
MLQGKPGSLAVVPSRGEAEIDTGMRRAAMRFRFAAAATQAQQQTKLH